ncbi:MAG: penicillin-binding protein 2 [Parcubacteria group bacterium LiPW_39]|nr:MAG: penicillin-binding protein 2 [Parcubacteria group bacterium LiPW_39]
MKREYKVKRIFKEAIEPEEILLDATKSSELENQRLEVHIKPGIFKAFFYLMLAVFLVLAGYSAYLQIIKGSYYQDLAEHNRLRSVPIFAPRGIIYDRSLKQLVHNVPVFNLVLTLPDLPRSAAAREAVIKKAAEIIGVPPPEIFDKLENIDLKLTPTMIVGENLNHEVLLLLESKIEQLPGFRIEKNIVRQYADASYFSHLLGYLGKLGKDDIKNNPDYFLTEKIGKNGLEFFYEKILRGRPGEQLIETDSRGQRKNPIAQNQPQDGQGLVLTIDSELQKNLYDSLARILRGMNLKKAAALALNPQTGGILALISFPSFDNNIFAKELSPDEYAKLAEDPLHPFLNRAIAGRYAPGSTVKPLIGAAALQEKVVTPSTTINDTGELTVINQYNPQIVHRYPDWKVHGIVNIYSAIAQSCNVYFYTIGGGYGNINGLGVERLKNYFKLFGFGSILGIDLSGEARGLVPDSQWKQNVKDEQWYIGDTYHVSIGQGDLLVTPLQLAVATAAIVNGGKIIQPHLIDKIVDSDKNVIKTIEPKIIQQGFIDEANFAIIKKAMRQTVTDGSAFLLNDLSFAVGAKTGTAQVAGQRNPNAWVTVFAPYDNPEMVLVVLVENAGEGSQVAVPVIKEVLQKYYSNN